MLLLTQGFYAVFGPKNTPLVWHGDYFSLRLNQQIICKVWCAANPPDQWRPWGTCEESSAPSRPRERSSAGVHTKLLPLPGKQGWSETSEGYDEPSWRASQIQAGSQLPNCSSVFFFAAQVQKKAAWECPAICYCEGKSEWTSSWLHSWGLATVLPRDLAGTGTKATRW